MTFDRKDWDEKREKRIQEAEQQQIPQYQEVVRAIPEMQKLTGRPEWDKYLTYLEGILKATEIELIDLRVKLESPKYWKTEDLVQLKAEVIRLKERYETIDTLMKLPKEIIEIGKAAKSTLERFH